MQTIRVQHKMITDKRGLAQYIHDKRVKIETIRFVYKNNKVQTQSGDVWEVRPDTQSKATFESVAR